MKFTVRESEGNSYFIDDPSAVPDSRTGIVSVGYFWTNNRETADSE